MREFGQPMGMAGYDEIPAARPSYGPYCALTYVPYFLASFFTGYDSHNFMYVINAAFGVLACLIIVLTLRPTIRQSLLAIVLVGSEFVIAKFLCSGMTEGSYVLYGAIFACSALVALRSSREQGRKWPGIVALVVMIASTGFWGGMRPYILAFMLVPWLLLIAHDFGLSKLWRVLLALLGVAAAIGAFAYYMYASKYYATPYLATTSFADDFFSILASSLAGLLDQNVAGILYSCKKFVHLRFRGVLLFAFALCFIVLLVMCVICFKRKKRVEAFLYLGLLLAGLAIYEANLLLYSYKQMYRMMIVVDVVFFIAILFGDEVPKLGGKIPVRAIVVVLSCVTCIGSLPMNVGEFSYPQHGKNYDPAKEAAVTERLLEAMPQSDDQWDNTVAHPIESGNIHLYYQLPHYLNTNNLRVSYTELCMEGNTFKSKYVSIPRNMDLNKKMKKRYPVVFKGDRHIIYQVRD